MLKSTPMSLREPLLLTAQLIKKLSQKSKEEARLVESAGRSD
jgi:hypothetical protein